MAKHKLTQAERRKFVSDVAKLRKAGLVSSKVDPRTQDATDYMKRQIRKYNDVIKGNAQAVKIKAPKGQTVSDIKSQYSQFASKGDRIIVPTRKGDRVTFSTTRGLGTTRRAYGTTWRVQYIKGIDKTDLPTLQRLASEGYAFSIPFRNGATKTITYRYWSDPAEMMRDMSQYHSYNEWASYIEIVKPAKRVDTDDYREEHYGDDPEGNGLRFTASGQEYTPAFPGTPKRPRSPRGRRKRG